MPPRRHLSGEYSESDDDDRNAPGGAPPAALSSAARASSPPAARTRSSTPASTPAPRAPADLEAMKYRDLQKSAKQLGVKANLARPQLVQKILEALANRPEGERLIN